MPARVSAGVTGAQGRVSDRSTQHFMMKQIIAKKPRRDEDPREALLKYADKATADPAFLGAAYAKTQPTPIYGFAGAGAEAKKALSDKQAELAHKRMA